MTQTAEFGLHQAIEELLRDEGWRDITLEAFEDGYQVEAHHGSDPRRERIIFGLGPADLDAIARSAGIGQALVGSR